MAEEESAAEEEIRPGSALEGMLMNGKRFYTGAEEDDFTIRIDNKIVAGTNVVEGIAVPDKQIWMDNKCFGETLEQTSGEMSLYYTIRQIDRGDIGIDGTLDTTKFKRHLKDAGVTNFQEFANYLDQKVMGIATDDPVLSSNPTGTETMNLRITITNWDDLTTYTPKILAGVIVDKGEGKWDWELPDIPGAAEDHTIWFTAAAEGRDDSNTVSLTISVEPLTSTADQIILFEDDTMTTVEFPTTTDVDMGSNSLKAKQHGATAESMVITQDAGEGKFINGKPTMVSKTNEYIIKDGATADKVDLSGMRLADGDIVMVGNTAEMVEYNTTGKVSIEGGGSTKAPGEDMELLFPTVEDTAYDAFGQAMTMNSTMVAFGAPYYGTDDIKKCGCVWVYDKDFSNGFQLSAATKYEDARFGYCVAMSDTKIYVGCPHFSNADGDEIGCIYVYDIDGSNEYILTVSDPVEKERLGEKGLVVTDNALYVGSYNKPVGDIKKEGCVYMYDLDLTNERKIYGPSGDRKENHRFGKTIAVRGDLLLIAAPMDDEGGSKTGAVYMCELDGTIKKKLICNKPCDGANFGTSLAIGVNQIAIGAVGYQDLDVIDIKDIGGVFIYDLDGNNEIRVLPDKPKSWGMFGGAVAIAGSKMVYTAKGQKKDDVDSVGAVYVADLDGGGRQLLEVPYSMKNGGAGYSAMMDENFLYFDALKITAEESDYRNGVFRCASGAGPVECSLDITAAGLADVPTVVAKEIGKISTSTVKAGRDAKYEARTIESYSYADGKVTAVYDADFRAGEDFQVKVDMAARGAEVVKIEVPIEKTEG